MHVQPTHVSTPPPRHRSRLRRIAATAAPIVAVPSLLVLAPPAQAATTYVVDQNAAGCANGGPGDSTTPFCQIWPATARAVPGDTVQVRAGTYREQVNPQTGVTYVTTGSAVLLGTDSLASATWVPSVTSVGAYTTVLTGTAVPRQVFSSSGRMTQAASADQVSGGRWFFDAATRTLTVNVGHAPTAADELEMGVRGYGFFVNVKSDVTIDGFVTRRQNTAGVGLADSSNIRVENVTATESGSYGIDDLRGTGNRISNSKATDNESVGIRLRQTTNSSVLGGEASGNGFHGVSVQGGSGARVTRVVATANVRPSTRVATGIDVSEGSVGAVIERNTTYRNDDSGIEIYVGSNNAIVRRNLTYDNGDHGIDISRSTGAVVVSNTSVGNDASGLNVEGGATGTTLRNNISADDAVGSTRTNGNIRVQEDSIPGTTTDRNLVFQSGGTAPLYEWGGINYSTIGAFRTASGQEARGMAADPKFVSLAGRDLRLTGTSPAVDAADSNAPGWVNDDRNGNPPVDHPGVPNTGQGPVTFADLGALELTDVPADAAPTAKLTANPATITAGGSTTLDASASTDDVGITEYTFDCKNGTAVATKTTATHTCTYATAGTYKPTVTVKDAANHTATAEATVTVNAPPDGAPTAKLTANPATITAGGSTTLDASGSTDDKGIVEYKFDCKNGTAVATKTTATHTCTYATAGTYKPTVTVKDAANHTASAEATVTVNPAGPGPGPGPGPSDGKPKASLTVTPASITAGGSTTLDASASTDDKGIVEYKFDCNNGAAPTTTTSKTVSCTYATAGTYRPTVTVKDAANQTDSASATVTVQAAPEKVPPTAMLVTSRDTMRQGQQVVLDASGSTGAVTYTFKCGNQRATAPQTSPQASCTFRWKGLKTVSVTATNADGTDTATAEVLVNEGWPPTARLALSDRTPHRGQKILADASASTGTAVSEIKAYRFQCGGKARTSWSTRASTRCEFGSTGWRRITVWVKSTLGIVDAKTKRVYVSR